MSHDDQTAEIIQLETERDWLRVDHARLHQLCQFLQDERALSNKKLEREILEGNRLRTELAKWTQEVDRISRARDDYRERLRKEVVNRTGGTSCSVRGLHARNALKAECRLFRERIEQIEAIAERL